ncbi:hypothetical protein FRC06_008786, partial [Ceratobasidium sp. 370]
MLLSEFRCSLREKDPVEPTISGQSVPVFSPAPTSANARLATETTAQWRQQTPGPDAAPPHPNPLVPSPTTANSTFHQFEPPTQPARLPLIPGEFDSGLFDSDSLDLPLAFDPSLVFDPSLAFDPSLTFDLGRHVEHAMGPFWNPWVEDAGQVQQDIATHNLDTPSAPDNTIGGLHQIRHRLPLGEAYVRIVSKGRIIYRHPTAGRSYGKGKTRWEVERDKNIEQQGGNRWGMWKHKDEWETVKWMATTKVSQSSLNKLLKTERYREVDYSFKMAKALFKKIREEMGGFGRPEWHAEDVRLPGADDKDIATLLYRDPQESADFLFGCLWFAGKMVFAPEIHYNTDEEERLLGNPWTANGWGERQNTLPPGTTLGGLLFASDSTQLSTHSGDVAAHAVYMSLANIDKSTRVSTSENAWILVAYIPKSKFTHTMAKLEDRPKDIRTKVLGVLNHCLFHRCMEVVTRSLRHMKPHNIIDPEGNIWLVLYAIIAYIADLEEQWLIAGLGKQTCPYCESDPTHLGDHESSPLRTPADILAKINEIKKKHREAWGHSPLLEEFTKLAGEHHLNG